MMRRRETYSKENYNRYVSAASLGDTLVNNISKRNVTTEADVQKHYPFEDVQRRKIRSSGWRRVTQCLRRHHDDETSNVSPLTNDSNDYVPRHESTASFEPTCMKRIWAKLASCVYSLISPFRFVWCIFALLGHFILYAYKCTKLMFRERAMGDMAKNRVPMLRFIEMYHKAIWFGTESDKLSEDSGDSNRERKSTPPQIDIGVDSREMAYKSIAIDIAAGFLETIMALPQAMSYSLLANVPIVQGLIGQAVFPGIFSTFTTAYTVCAGVSAIENLMAGDSITRLLGKVGTAAERVNCGSALALAVGLSLITMYILQLGVISSLLSDPVLEGFMTASVFVMTMAQVPHILGLHNVPSGLSTVGIFIFCTSHINETQYMDFMVAAASLILLILIKFLDSKIPKVPLPGPLIVVIVGILVTTYTGIEVDVIGEIPAGFPKPVVPAIAVTVTGAYDENIGTIPTIVGLVREGFLMAFLFYVVHVSIARAVANITNLPIDANQELLALGLTNTCGSFFQTFPNASSLSRTSLVTSLGARTPFHSYISVASIILIIYFATSLFSNLPFSCLSSIVIFGVSRMVSFKNLKRLYGHQMEILRKKLRVHEKDDTNILCHDFLLWITAFLITLFIGTLEGILFSLGLSILLILASSSRPPTAQLGRLPRSNIFRNIKRFPIAHTYKGIVVFRFDASLIFSNASYFSRTVKNQINELLNNGILDRDENDKKEIRPVSPEQIEWMCKVLTSMIKTLRKGGVDLLDPIERDRMRNIDTLDGHEVYGYLRGAWCYPPVLVIDASSMNELDMTAVKMLERLVPYAQENGVLFLLANWKGPVRDFLEFSDFYKTLPPDRCFLSLPDAVLTALAYQATLRSIIFGYKIDNPPELLDESDSSAEIAEVKARTTAARYFTRSFNFEGNTIAGIITSDLKSNAQSETESIYH